MFGVDIRELLICRPLRRMFPMPVVLETDLSDLLRTGEWTELKLAHLLDDSRHVKDERLAPVGPNLTLVKAGRLLIPKLYMSVGLISPTKGQRSLESFLGIQPLQSAVIF